MITLRFGQRRDIKLCQVKKTEVHHVKTAIYVPVVGFAKLRILPDRPPTLLTAHGRTNKLCFWLTLFSGSLMNSYRLYRIFTVPRHELS
jgi:hypothetical protein